MKACLLDGPTAGIVWRCFEAVVADGWADSGLVEAVTAAPASGPQSMRGDALTLSGKRRTVHRPVRVVSRPSLEDLPFVQRN